MNLWCGQWGGVFLPVFLYSSLLVEIAKCLFRVFHRTVDVEGSNVFLVGTAGHVLEMCHIAQTFEFGLVKDLFLDFQRFELFTPFQCS
jgi:hypothetical protein